MEKWSLQVRMQTFPQRSQREVPLVQHSGQDKSATTGREIVNGTTQNMGLVTAIEEHHCDKKLQKSGQTDFVLSLSCLTNTVTHVSGFPSWVLFICLQFALNVSHKCEKSQHNYKSSDTEEFF